MDGKKFKTLLVGKYKNPLCFKNVNKAELTVCHTISPTSWGNAEKLKKRFMDIMVRDLEQHYQNRNFEVHLLIDNCAAYPEILCDFDPRIQVVFLPLVTAAIQPMDQRLIATFKAFCKKFYYNNLVEFVLEHQGLPDPMEGFIKKYTIWHAIKNIDKAWESVKEGTIQKYFNKVIGSKLLMEQYKNRNKNNEIDGVYEIEAEEQNIDESNKSMPY